MVGGGVPRPQPVLARSFPPRGVDKGTISAIVRGTQPGLEVCKALATFFQQSPEHALRLAGHLNMIPTNLPPEALVLLHELGELPEPQQRPHSRCGARSWK